MHSPTTQRWPPAHGGVDPQEHAPLPLHRSALLTSHETQALPLIPHVVSDAGLLQIAPAQQPFVHDVASQRHAPFMHRCPV
jgi:hypothetical protein